MTSNGRHYLICDKETYSKEILARVFQHSVDWIEKNILFPCDSKTRKPLLACRACSA